MTRRESLLARVTAAAEGMTDEAIECLIWQAAHICRCGALMTRRSSQDVEGGERVYLICAACGVRKSRFLLCGYNVKNRNCRRKGARIGASKAATTRQRKGTGPCR